MLCLINTSLASLSPARARAKYFFSSSGDSGLGKVNRKNIGGYRMKVVAFLPIKLNSQRLPKKNILPISTFNKSKNICLLSPDN